MTGCSTSNSSSGCGTNVVPAAMDVVVAGPLGAGRRGNGLCVGVSGIGAVYGDGGSGMRCTPYGEPYGEAYGEPYTGEAGNGIPAA